jgi:hypothetical protein
MAAQAVAADCAVLRDGSGADADTLLMCRLCFPLLKTAASIPIP